MLAMLERAWVEHVAFIPSPDMTLRELHILETTAVDARAMIQRLLLWVESSGSRGFTPAERQKVVKACRTDRATLPTMERLSAEEAATAANTPAAKAAEQEAARLAGRAERHRQQVAEAAQYRRFGHKTTGADEAPDNALEGQE
jgi:hypothetical protein